MSAAAIETTSRSPSSDCHPDPLRQARITSLEHQITELAAHIHAATYQLLMLIHEYDECGGWNQGGLNSCAHWLNWKCGIDLGAAREKVRTAKALKDLPRISADFEKGRISYSKVRAMTRVATPGNEEVLLHIARHGTAAHVEQVVRDYRYANRIVALEDENARHAARNLSWHSDHDGSWVIRGRLTAEQGAIVQAALEWVMDELFEEQRNASEDVSAETSLGAQEREPIAHRRADALVRLAEKSAGTGGDRCRVNIHANIHTDMNTLKADGLGADAELEGHGRVSAETSRRLACDCAVVKWLDGENGEPLAIGRQSRSIPPAIRRALKRRDRGCRFPGCTCSRHVDAHHVIHWADGGETEMDNLVLLCRRHHRLVHEGGFGVSATDKGFEFTDPKGAVIPLTGQNGRFSGNVIELRHRNRQRGLDIGPNTPIPDWHGEAMDRQMVVEHLLRRE